MTRQPKRTAQQRCSLANLRRDRAEGRDPTSGAAFIGAQPECADIRLTPREFSLADEHERVSEIVERLPQFFDSEDQFLGGDTPLSVLDSRDRLPILEAEQARKIFLRQLALFAQCPDARADQLGCHGNSSASFLSLRNTDCKKILRNRQ